MITKEENLKYFVEIMALHGIDLDPDDENENSYYHCNDNGNCLADAISAVANAHRVLSGTHHAYEKVHLKLGQMAYEMELTDSDIDEHIEYLIVNRDIERVLKLSDLLKNSEEYKSVMDKTSKAANQFYEIPDDIEDSYWSSSYAANVDGTKCHIRLQCSFTNVWYGELTPIRYSCTWIDRKTRRKQYVESYIPRSSFPQWVRTAHITDTNAGNFSDAYILQLSNISLTLVVNRVLTRGLPKVKPKKVKTNVK